MLSPSNTKAWIERKIAEYLALGSQRVWIVGPSSRTVIIHHANGATTNYADKDLITHQELLPGFSLPLSDIFS